MAIGYGLGIGLQGTPKDYVDIIRSRDAAAAKNAAAKAAREAKKLERVEQDFIRTLSTTKVLPVQQKIVNEKLAEFNTALNEEVDSDTPNINRLNMLATNFGVTMNELAVTKSYWDDISKDATAYGLTAEEAGLLSYESDPGVWDETLKQFGSGRVTFDPTTLQVVVNPIKGYKTVGQIFNEYTNEGTNPDMYDYTQEIGTKRVADHTVKIYAIKPEFADTFAIQNITNPSIDVEMTKEYRALGKTLPPIGTPQYIDEKTKYLQGKFDELSKPFQRAEKYSKGPQYVTNVNTGQQEAIGAPSFEIKSNVYLDGADNYNTYGSFTSKEAKITGGTGSGTYNLNTHDRLTTGTAGMSTTSLYIVPVFKKNTTSGIYLTKSGVPSKKPITFNAGEIVPASMEDAQSNAGNVEFKLVGLGAISGTGSKYEGSYVIDANSAIQSMKTQVTTKAAQAEFDKHIQRMKDEVNKLNGGKTSGGSSSGARKATAAGKP
jgi:hypothetical protein